MEQDFRDLVTQHVLGVAQDKPEHLAFIKTALQGLEPFLTLMSGKAPLRHDRRGIEPSVRAALAALPKTISGALKNVAIRAVPMEQMTTAPGKSADYNWPVMLMLGDDYCHFTTLHGSCVEQVYDYVMKNTSGVVPQLFGHMMWSTLTHFDRELISDMITAYHVLTTMLVTALIRRDEAAYRRLQPFADLLTKAMPIGVAKGDSKVFYLLVPLAP